jgi:N-acyl homoserine lactone hydrolase
MRHQEAPAGPDTRFHPDRNGPAMRRSLLASIIIVTAAFMSTGPAAADSATTAIRTAAARPAHAKPVRSLRLYVLDCGTIAPMDPALFGLKPEEVPDYTGFVTPCYLIVHPKGSLIWDVGQIPDEQIPGDGTEAVKQGLLKARRRLAPQLAEVGFSPRDITYIAMSHYHIDHTANANLFAASTWIVQQAEYDFMFSDHEGIRDPQTYQALKTARRITLHDSDHDVFGDGTVVIKSAPGHTPGHQMLFLKLAHHGAIVLAGDLYHFPQERTLDRVPGFDFDAGMTRASRMKTEELLRTTGAQLWIQHDPATYAGLKKAPEFYD